MSSTFYLKMAVSNIGKNRKIYFPYIIMSIFSIMMYYMMNSLIDNRNVQTMPHAENVIMLLNVGLWVARIFTVIFLFYINSFLMKRRTKEIGLYNILGMEKRHIGMMMFFETVCVSAVSIAAGLILGIVFSKLMFLVLLKLIAADSVPRFDIQVQSVLHTTVYFLAIFGVAYLYNLCKIHLSNTIELLHGGEIGEKEPKTKLLLTIIGVLCLGGGYYFALVVKSPLTAMNLFLGAVILVIIGTYALFTAGSIALLKLLRKNKRFYYKTGHFMSVSGMIYRMKQNAVGLANICILSTMVLISVSTTVSMYIGMEDTIRNTYPAEINISGHLTEYDSSNELDTAIQKVNETYHAEPQNYTAMHSLTIMAVSQGNGVYMVDSQWAAYMESDGVLIAVMTLDEYNQMSGEHYTLNPGEILLYSGDKEAAGFDSMKLALSDEDFVYDVKEHLSKVDDKIGMGQYSGLVKCMAVVVDSREEFHTLYQKLSVQSGGSQTMDYSVLYNTQLSEAQSRELAKALDGIEVEGAYMRTDNQYDMREQFHQMYGGFLFIGMFIGALFLMATTLIIYYKQISEGFEDKKRFEIMQNVGMSREEVKKTIRSQVLTVFFLPLLAAGLHVAVSFRIMKMILEMLSLGNTGLFELCTVLTLLVFCAIYGIVFMLTAKSYYGIVKAED